MMKIRRGEGRGGGGGGPECPQDAILEVSETTPLAQPTHTCIQNPHSLTQKAVQSHHFLSLLSRSFGGS